MVHATQRDNQRQTTNTDRLYQKVVPMRLFATWDIDRTSSDCVPRLFTMSLNRLTIFSLLESDLTSLLISLKLQGYKRILRSNDIIIQCTPGRIDVDLDISFTLQYPHFIKKRNNFLLVMLQRRKKYKGRSLPGGFKTLAVGVINLTEILQNSSRLKELPLYGDIKDVQSTKLSSNQFANGTQESAKLHLQMLSSQPLEQEEARLKDLQSDCTDEDDDESTTNEDGGGASDSEMHSNAGTSKGTQSTAKRLLNQQRNLKQKFVALLKRFKIPEEEVLRAVNPNSQQATEQDMRDLFDELENFSNSDQENYYTDTLPVKSTPRPSLRPFFGECDEVFSVEDNVAKESDESKESGDAQGYVDTIDQDILESCKGIKNVTDLSLMTKPSNSSYIGERNTEAALVGAKCAEIKKIFPRRRQKSADFTTTSSMDAKSTSGRLQKGTLERSRGPSFTFNRLRGSEKGGEQLLNSTISPSTTFLSHPSINEQLSQIFPSEDKSFVPDLVTIVSAIEVQCHNLIDKLRHGITTRLVIVSSQMDVKAIFTNLINRQKCCKTGTFQTQNALKLLLVGGDRLFAQVLKSYTEVLAEKPNEWLHYFRIFLIGPPWSVLCRFMSTADHIYSGLFNNAFWREWWDKTTLSDTDIIEIVNRLSKYVQNAKLTVPLPIAEAMLQLKETSSGDEMSHVFVPFLMELRRATTGESGSDSLSDSLSRSPSAIDQQTTPKLSALTASPTGGIALTNDVFSPVSHSPSPKSPHFFGQASFAAFSYGDAQELHIEYWTSAAVTNQAISGSPGAIMSAGVANPNVSNVSTKYSLKTLFKSLVISRFPSGTYFCSESTGPALTMQFMQEKKKDKVLQKLGMKNKEKVENEQKLKMIEGINRLVCSAKQHTPMKLTIDGVEWTNIKFFQVSSQWQTHVKFMPIALFNID